MMRHEFERLVGEQISDDDWELVDLVYNLHPRDFTKEEIATLWKIGGREALEGLRPVAEKVRDYENRLYRLEYEIKKINKELSKIREAYGRTKKEVE